MGVMNPGLVMRNVIPVVMAGILGIYGLIVSVIITGNSKSITDTVPFQRKHMSPQLARSHTWAYGS